MAAVDDDVQKDGFSFVWTIQNFSYCVETSFESPVFLPNEKENDKFCLILYPSGMSSSDSDTIALNLRIPEYFTKKKEVSFDLSICTPMGIFKQEGAQRRVCEFYSSKREFGFSSTIRLKDLKNEKSRVYIDSLTVRCIIWEINKKPVETGQFHVRTIIAVERTSYMWNIHNFLEFNNKKKPTKRPPILSGISSFTMELASTGGTFAEDNIQIVIKHIEEIKNIKEINDTLFCTCEMSLLGIDRKIVYSVRNEHRFKMVSEEISKETKIWKLSFIPKDKLLSNKEVYLPNGALSLHCEFAVSSGVTFYEVEGIENGIDHLSKLEICKEAKDSDVSGSLKENLECFYTKGQFSDLTIHTPSKDYPVHKSILCARSEVFSAMFESDTKEKLTGVVDIEDLDDDIVSKMLLFIYTDSIGEDLEFKTASSLYFAADKYRIVALKKKCADFLKSNFTSTNVCDVLVNGDLHQDQELESAAQDFLFEHSAEIMHSEEWKIFMKNNVQLASETMHKLIKRFSLI